MVGMEMILRGAGMIAAGSCRTARMRVLSDVESRALRCASAMTITAALSLSSDLGNVITRFLGLVGTVMEIKTVKKNYRCFLAVLS